MTVYLTNYQMAAINNVLLSGGASIANKELYLGFTTASPTGSGSYTNEPTSAGSYARKAVGATGTGTFPTATAAIAKNTNAAITTATSSAAWSTGATNLTHWFLSDSATIGAGNMIAYGALGSAFAVNAANIAPSFPSGSGTEGLQLTLQS
jgi:hypothetical protein